MKIFGKTIDRTNGWSIARASAFAVMIVLSINPEIRALRLIVDLFGIDLLLLLCFARMRSHGPVVGVVRAIVTGSALTLVSRMGAIADRSARAVLPREELWLGASAMLAACAFPFFRASAGSAPFRPFDGR